MGCILRYVGRNQRSLIFVLMKQLQDLMEETMSHFDEGATSVRAYSNDITYIITKAGETDDFWVTREEPGFPKTKTHSLDAYFQDVFGIEARY